jgi:hypothetical protein
MDGFSQGKASPMGDPMAKMLQGMGGMQDWMEGDIEVHVDTFEIDVRRKDDPDIERYRALIQEITASDTKLVDDETKSWLKSTLFVVLRWIEKIETAPTDDKDVDDLEF